MDRSIESARALVRATTGPLSPHLEAFVSSLIEQRYAPWSVHLKAYRAVDFSVWLAEQQLGLCSTDERTIARYHSDRSRGRPRPWRNEFYALRQLLAFLRERGAIAPAASRQAVPADAVVRRYEEHLLHVRGLAVRTVPTYTQLVRQFLLARFGGEVVDLQALRASEVIAFVQRRSKQMRPRRLKLLITALRSFLRHAQMLGEVAPGIVASVPAVSVWSSTPALPRAISAEHARRAIDACDRRTCVGRRDRAVLLLLARLGLRSGEVAALMLEDVDWDAGRLRVRGKGAREAFLPLPVDVGQALAAYLRDGRQAADDRHFFLRARAPVCGFKNSAVAVASIVMHALARAGVDAPHKGAHQFRHALATQLLRGGASLEEIGELLRHRSSQSTSLYARVDLVALRELATAWPGATR